MNRQVVARPPGLTEPLSVTADGVMSVGGLAATVGFARPRHHRRGKRQDDGEKRGAGRRGARDGGDHPPDTRDPRSRAQSGAP